jgi:hypothetical protein
MNAPTCNRCGRRIADGGSTLQPGGALHDLGTLVLCRRCSAEFRAFLQAQGGPRPPSPRGGNNGGGAR